MEQGIVEHKCTICQSVSENQDAFSSHFQEHHRSIFFACYLCPRSFQTVNQVLTHLNNEHNTINPERKKIAMYDHAIMARGTVRVGYVEGESVPLTKIERKLWSNQKCAVDGCGSNVDSAPAVKLFRFPASDVHQRYLWVAILNKRNPDGTEWEAKPWHRICSLHFEDGKYSRDEKDINYIPTLLPDALGDEEMFRMPPQAADQVIFLIFFLVLFLSMMTCIAMKNKLKSLLANFFCVLLICFSKAGATS